ncbi:MAG: site-specific integrase, partial [Gammaproteobacteria bacterium]
MPAADLIDHYLDAAWVEQGLSENTLAAYSSDLRIFAAWLKDKPMLEADGGQLSQ